jgi:hypothetical protein
VRTEVFTAVIIKFTVIWDVTSCNLVDRRQCFGGTYPSALKLKAAVSSETYLLNYMT